MKNIISTLILLFGITYYTFGQVGYNHITLRGGITLESDYNFELGYEFNKKYFNNWSVFFNGFTSDKINRETQSKIRNWTFGVYYEPNLIANKNHFINWRFGTSAGTNEDEFIIDLIAGLEYYYAIGRSTKISFYLKNNYVFNSDIEFRHALLIGFKQRF